MRMNTAILNVVKNAAAKCVAVNDNVVVDAMRKAGIRHLCVVLREGLAAMREMFPSLLQPCMQPGQTVLPRLGSARRSALAWAAACSQTAGAAGTSTRTAGAHRARPSHAYPRHRSSGTSLRRR